MRHLRKLMAGVLAFALAMMMTLSVSAAEVPSATPTTETTTETTTTKRDSSPKTGVGTEWELYSLAAAALAGCGVSFSRKKKG